MVALRILTVHASNRKGELKPISVVIKVRQGRKACTLITGYETFGLQADELAEELRKTCASSTSGIFLLLFLPLMYQHSACCSIADARETELAGGHGAGQTVQSGGGSPGRAWGAKAVDRDGGSDAGEEKEVAWVLSSTTVKPNTNKCRGGYRCDERVKRWLAQSLDGVPVTYHTIIWL